MHDNYALAVTLFYEILATKRADIRVLEASLDARVAALYGLAPEEIKIVEESSG